MSNQFPPNSPLFSNIYLSAFNTGYVLLTVPPNVTTYDLILPASQGSAGQTLLNDGSGNLTWGAGGSGGVTLVGPFSATSEPNGALISGASIIFGPADTTNPGMIKSSGTQTLGATLTLNSLDQVTSATTHPATAGFMRLANTDAFDWRDSTNAANMSLGVSANTQNRLIYNGTGGGTSFGGLLVGDPTLINANTGFDPGLSVFGANSGIQGVVGSSLANNYGFVGIGTAYHAGNTFASNAGLFMATGTLDISMQAFDATALTVTTQMTWHATGDTEINSTYNLLMNGGNIGNSGFTKTPANIYGNNIFVKPAAGGAQVSLQTVGASSYVNFNTTSRNMEFRASGSGVLVFSDFGGNNNLMMFDNASAGVINLWPYDGGIASSLGTTSAPWFNVVANGRFMANAVGAGLDVKVGANARMGTSTLVGGTVVVSNTSVTANTKIFLTTATAGGTLGVLSYTSSVGTGFTITSTSALDTSTVNWMLHEAL